MAKEQQVAQNVTPEQVEAVSEDTAQLELEKLQKKIAREERKKRREIEASKQKQAKWLLPSLLLLTMLVSWFLSRLTLDKAEIAGGAGADHGGVEQTQTDNQDQAREDEQSEEG